MEGLEEQGTGFISLQEGSDTTTNGGKLGGRKLKLTPERHVSEKQSRQGRQIIARCFSAGPYLPSYPRHFSDSCSAKTAPDPEPQPQSAPLFADACIV